MGRPLKIGTYALADWQMWWPHWYRIWPSWVYDRDDDYDLEYIWFFFGPYQSRWVKVSW